MISDIFRNHQVVKNVNNFTVEIANDNSEGQLVLSGKNDDLDDKNKMEILFTHVTDELQTGWIEAAKYTNGNLALQLMTTEGAYATLSTNIEGVNLDKDCFIAKNYSENAKKRKKKSSKKKKKKKNFFKKTGEN